MWEMAISNQCLTFPCFNVIVSLFILHNIVHSSYIRLFTHYYASIVLYSILLADNEF